VRLQTIKEQFNGRISLRWRPFALRPQYNPGPFQFSGSYVEGAWQRAGTLAKPDGITYRMWDQEDFPRWSMPALEAGAAAQRQGEEAFQRFHFALFQAFFTGGKNIMEKETLVTVARETGLDVSAFTQDIDDPTLQQEVKRSCAEAVETYGISGVPTVIIGGKRRLVGAVPAEDYLKALEAYGLRA
jgi:predicted DsbA family dithiol-disulfide isomerase